MNNFLLMYNLGNALPRIHVDEVANSGKLVTTADNREVSDLLDHSSGCKYRCPALGRTEGLVGASLFLRRQIR